MCTASCARAASSSSSARPPPSPCVGEERGRSRNRGTFRRRPTDPDAPLPLPLFSHFPLPRPSTTATEARRRRPLRSRRTTGIGWRAGRKSPPCNPPQPTRFRSRPSRSGPRPRSTCVRALAARRPPILPPHRSRALSQTPQSRPRAVLRAARQAGTLAWLDSLQGNANPPGKTVAGWAWLAADEDGGCRRWCSLAPEAAVLYASHTAGSISADRTMAL